jgi:glycosyltransferase involved in cell wall biosynthesis
MREMQGVRIFKKAIREFNPDVISVWNMSQLSSALLMLVKRAAKPVRFHLDDDWMLNEDVWFRAWKDYNRFWMRMVKRVVRGWVDHRSALLPGLDAGAQCVFISKFRRDQYALAGWPVATSEVIYGGIPETFLTHDNGVARRDSYPYRILFVGMVSPAKAPHLAIEALALLRTSGMTNVCLDIVGLQHQPEYSKTLRALVQRHGLEQQVVFLGAQPRDTLPSVYRAHDALVFTSVAAEGFPLTILEAMGSRLPVIASLSGGQNEIIEQGVNALGFTPGDVGALAAHIRLLVEQPTLAQRLACAGQALVRDHFTTDEMVQRHEALFQKAMRT